MNNECITIDILATMVCGFSVPIVLVIHDKRISTGDQTLRLMLIQQCMIK